MTVCHSLHTITTNFQAANPPALEYTGTRDLLDGVSLPDGRVWTFTYDQYGDISSILLPTGASISYQWQAVETYIDEYTFDEDRQVVSRKLYDGGSKYYTWNYKYFTPPI